MVLAVRVAESKGCVWRLGWQDRSVAIVAAGVTRGRDSNGG